MANFMFDETVPLPPGSVITAALGVDASHGFTSEDVGKPVKLAGLNNYVVCGDGDTIEGFVTSVEPATVNNGFSHGGVLKWIPGLTRMTVKVNTATSVAVRDYVIASAQAALGTANSNNKTPYVKKGLGSEAMAWRVISLLDGAGAQNSLVLVEAVGMSV